MARPGPARIRQRDRAAEALLSGGGARWPRGRPPSVAPTKPPERWAQRGARCSLPLHAAHPRGREGPAGHGAAWGRGAGPRGDVGPRPTPPAVSGLPAVDIADHVSAIPGLARASGMPSSGRYRRWGPKSPDASLFAPLRTSVPLPCSSAQGQAIRAPMSTPAHLSGPAPIRASRCAPQDRGGRMCPGRRLPASVRIGRPRGPGGVGSTPTLPSAAPRHTVLLNGTPGPPRAPRNGAIGRPWSAWVDRRGGRHMTDFFAAGATRGWPPDRLVRPRHRLPSTVETGIRHGTGNGTPIQQQAGSEPLDVPHR